MSVAVAKKVKLPILQRMRPLIRENPWGAFTLPEKMVWTSSSKRQFDACKRKWFWKYIMRLSPRYADKNLMIGGMFHRVLGEWYRSRRTNMRRIVKRFGEELRQEMAASNEYFTTQDEADKLRIAVDGFEGMLLAYGEKYAHERDEWIIEKESIEKEACVDLGGFYYAGKIDLAARHRTDKTDFIVEHKTAGNLPASYLERLPMDTQVRGYVFLARRDLELPVDRVMYDAVRKCKLRKKKSETIDELTLRIREDYLNRDSFYFMREELRFDKHDLASFEFELYQTHKEYLNIIGALRDKDKATYEELIGPGAVDLIQLDPHDPRTWKTNDKHCDAYFRMCEYFLLCTEGMDEGSSRLYDQHENLNVELELEVE